MPTILRLGAYDVKIYFNDHLPPHVHVRCGRRQIVVYLNDDLPVEDRGMRRFEISRAKGIVAEHYDLLIAEWERIYNTP